MLDLIVRILAWVLSLCTPPPPGRHRLAALTPEEHRRQRERRRALYLATLGIDTGPRHIHGVRVPVAGGVR